MTNFALPPPRRTMISSAPLKIGQDSGRPIRVLTLVPAPAGGSPASRLVPVRSDAGS